MRIEKGEKMNALPAKKPLTKDVILSKTIEIAVKKGKLIISLNELSDELKKEYDITNLKVLIEQLWKEGKILLSWENQHLTTFNAEEQLRKEINELIEEKAKDIENKLIYTTSFANIIHNAGLEPEEFREKFMKLMEDLKTEDFSVRMREAEELARKIIKEQGSTIIPRTIPAVPIRDIVNRIMRDKNAMWRIITFGFNDFLEHMGGEFDIMSEFAGDVAMEVKRRFKEAGEKITNPENALSKLLAKEILTKYYDALVEKGIRGIWDRLWDEVVYPATIRIMDTMDKILVKIDGKVESLSALLDVFAQYGIYTALDVPPPDYIIKKYNAMIDAIMKWEEEQKKKK
jgi:hypothetical protein